jgi:hypothetical protein
VGAGADAFQVPEFLLVELSDHGQELGGGGIYISVEFGDLLAEEF